MKKLATILLTIFVLSSFLEGERDFSIEELIGKLDPKYDNNFVKISEEHLVYKRDIFLRKEVYEAFVQMHKAALDSGVSLKIVSGFRSFNYQKYLWERKWEGQILVDSIDPKKEFPDEFERAKFILNYTAMPGISRHHWGTDIDIHGVEIEDFETPEGIKIYNWLIANANNFGFCQTYDTTVIDGFSQEKWHWSYMPTAKMMLVKYQEKIKISDIRAFKGCETADILNVIQNHVFNISKHCSPETTQEVH